MEVMKEVAMHYTPAFEMCPEVVDRHSGAETSVAV